LPKFQLHAIGLPLERSWKLTISGEQPASGEAEKFATGFWPEAVIVSVSIVTKRMSVFARGLWKRIFSVLDLGC
jgi:hypothetical protein